MKNEDQDQSVFDVPTIKQSAADDYPDTGAAAGQPGPITISQLMTQRGITTHGVALDGEFEREISAYLSSNDPRKYEVGDLLARGGMGEVLFAKDLNCRRKVAMKVLGDASTSSNDQILRFVVEAQITAQLEHPSIVPVYDLSVDHGGGVFYTMKLVRGKTLVDILTGIKRGNIDLIEKYSLIRLLNIFIKICDAVAYAHSKGVVHRDLKPENVMIGDYGEVLLMDWGLAKIIKGGPADRKISAASTTPKEDEDDDDDDYRLDARPDDIDSILSDGDVGTSYKTLDGQIMGTPGFMPPEQAMGKVDEIDERSDIYALGGILYNILTLQPSVTGRYIQKMVRMIVKGDIKPPESFNDSLDLPHCPNNKIPHTLSAIAMKALATKPENRYASVHELESDIERFVGGFATSVEEPGLFNLVVLAIKRHKMEFIWLCITTVILVAVVTGFMLRIVEEKKRAEQNLVMFLQEKDVRREISNRLVTTAMQALGHLNPKQTNLSVHHILHGDDIDLFLQGNRYLADIRPLQGLPLAKLNLDNTAVSDISVVQSIPLEWLSLANTEVTDVTILKGKKLTLKWLNLAGTKVTTIAPLAGLKLYYLDLSETSVTDLTPVQSMNLETLILWDTPVDNLDAIAAMPLKTLGIDHRQFKQINIVRKMGIQRLMIKDPTSADIYIAMGLKVKELELRGRSVRDVDALRGGNLDGLSLVDTEVRDLQGLAGMALRTLKINGSKIKEIAVVRELPLQELVLDRCYFLHDITPVMQCQTLEKLLIPSHITDVEFLRNHPTLKVLAYAEDAYQDNQSVADFFARNAKK